MKLDPPQRPVVEIEERPDAGSPEEAALAKLDWAAAQAAAARAAARIHGVVIGQVVGWDSEGQVLVHYPGIPSEQPLPARATATLDASAIGRDVALMFVQGDPLQPVLMGLIERPGATPLPSPTQAAQVDGKQLVFTAEEEIVFRCGEASITLTKAGKVLLRGTYLLSRSSGVNRIKGGSVQIN
jgi:hypothetical protein